MNDWLNTTLGSSLGKHAQAKTEKSSTLGIIDRFYGRTDKTTVAKATGDKNNSISNTADHLQSTTVNNIQELHFPLDVSVGVDDPNILKTISLTFQGAPAGARFSHGEPVENDRWIVSALDLQDLTVIVPLGCASFDLQVVMRSQDLPPQSATISVSMEDGDGSQSSPEPSTAEPDQTSSGKLDANGNDIDTKGPGTGPAYVGAPLRIRLAPALDGTPQNLAVFADGRELTRQNIVWSNGTDVPEEIEVSIPREPNLPFEVVLRLIDAPTDAMSRPAFLGCEFQGTWLSPSHQAISMRGNVRGTGIVWTGDAVIDLRNTKDICIKKAKETEAQVAPPHQKNVPIDETLPPNVSEVQNVLQSDATSDIAVLNSSEQSSTSANVLSIPVAPDDLKSKSFIEELQRLRDFIETSDAGSGPAIYQRLGIDVSRWDGLRAISPSGADIELDPFLLNLSTIGGRDGGRRVVAMRVRRGIMGKARSLRISGSPPGTLFNVGRNLGNGEWEIEIEDVPRLFALEAVSAKQSKSNLWELISNDDDVLARGTFLYGDYIQRLTEYSDGYDGIEITVDAEIFDPKGYGSLSMTIGDVPPGILLDVGHNHGEGVWTFDYRSDIAVKVLSGLHHLPFALTMTCIAMDEATGDSTVVTKRIAVDPDGGFARIQDTKT